MDHQIVERRNVLRGAGVAGATMLGVSALPSSAVADGGHGGVLGAWVITHTDDPASENTPVLAVAAFTAGGVLITQDIAPASPGGLGAWEPRGGGRFAGTFWIGDTDENGGNVVVKVRVRGRASGDTIRGTYRLTASVDGNEAFTGTGTFHGHRAEV